MQHTNTFVWPQNVNVKVWKQETDKNISSEVSEIVLKFTKPKLYDFLLLLNAYFIQNISKN